MHQSELQDVVYEKAVGEGIAKASYISSTPASCAVPAQVILLKRWLAAQITINRPERRNAFRPQTTAEMIRCFDDARNDPDVGVVVLTGLKELACASPTCIQRSVQ